jgi:hypothetical protein
MINIAALTIDQLERLRDACSRRILELRPTKGLALPELLRLLEEVKMVLRDQRKEWHSLESWQWMDGEVRFWLNPRDQELYNSGWYTIDQLIEWSHNRGAVMIDAEEDEALWYEADGVQITWLPSERGDSRDFDREPTLLTTF